MSRIYYTKPSITDLEVRYATDAAAHGWGERWHEYIDRFEQAFRDHLRVRYAIATSSCTGALHMGLSALGLGPGEEVIVADINWVATVAPVVYLGATPVFVDILPDTWCIDPEKIKAAITTRTKAIIATHLYGNLCEMDAILEIGRTRGIPIIEDAAEALGSVYHGKRAGSLGMFGVFSFHGSKTITTGEGGMFVTNDGALYEKVVTLSNHGRSKGQSRQFWPDVIGYKYKLSNVQAAIGCAQMERFDELVAGKRRIFKYYESKLARLPLSMNPEKPGTVNGYWMPTIVVNKGVPFDRNSLLAKFNKNSIDARSFFWPLSMLPMFKRQPGNAVAYGLFERALNLPSYHDVDNDALTRICELVSGALGEKHGSYN
jgi:perosamine synthetase